MRRLNGGPPISVFESGAIMMYLAEKAGRFCPQNLRGSYEVNQWVMWQMANQGPKLGECGHFLRLGDKQGDQSYAVRRFTDEANRLYGVLNNRLYDRRYLAGDEYTIADMISYPWTVNWKGQGARHRRVQILQTLVRRTERAPGGPARPGRHGRPDGGPREFADRGARAAHETAIHSARPTGPGGRGLSRDLTGPSSQSFASVRGSHELSLERPLGSNKDGLPLGEAFYWMAEKLTWGYEDVEPDPAEAIKLLRQSADLGFSDALISWEIPRLCRGGSRSLTYPAVRAPAIHCH